MAEYIKIPITILVEKDSDIHKRLLRLTEASGYSMEEELDFLIRLGINPHLRANIKRMEAEYGILD